MTAKVTKYPNREQAAEDFVNLYCEVQINTSGGLCQVAIRMFFHHLLDATKLPKLSAANGEVGVTYVKDSWVRLAKHLYPCLVCCWPGYFPSFKTII